jgi:hypothetical protein
MLMVVHQLGPPFLRNPFNAGRVTMCWCPPAVTAGRQSCADSDGRYSLDRNGGVWSTGLAWSSGEDWGGGWFDSLRPAVSVRLHWSAGVGVAVSTLVLGVGAGLLLGRHRDVDAVAGLVR